MNSNSAIKEVLFNWQVITNEVQVDNAKTDIYTIGCVQYLKVICIRVLVNLAIGKI